MYLAVDFGTSYSAAARITDGIVELVRFGDSDQFRTAVFFPTNLPSIDEFELTDVARREIADAVRLAKNNQTREEKRIASLRKEALRLPSEKRDMALQMVPTLRRKTDAQMEAEAIALARRRWLASQTESALGEAASMQDAVYGDEALDAYMHGTSGYLVSSPKSMLGYSLIGQSKRTLTGVTTEILKHIKSTAEKQFRTKISHAVIGRPVAFRSSKGQQGTIQALAILTDSAYAAGFDGIYFLSEPAAAFCAATRSLPPSTGGHILVVDIGGGTTDLSFGTQEAANSIPTMENSWGLPSGGSDIDIEFSMASFMTLFGAGEDRMPNHLFYSASSVHDIERQRHFATYGCKLFREPYASRLRALQQHGATVRLNRAVERTKIFLSDHAEVKMRLNYIENGLVAASTRKVLMTSCERFLRNLKSTISEAVTQSGVVDTVFLTGGSSRAPYVISAVREVIGNSRLVMGDASYAVVKGLAYASQDFDANT